MAGYNTSSAYKLYETAAPAPKKEPRLRVVGRRSPKQALAVAFTPRVLCAFCVIVSLLCMIIYNQVQLNEMTGEINTKTNELTTLQSKYVYMASSLQSAISPRMVEEQARGLLGMDRPDKHQTEYVNLYQGDKIVLAEQPPEEEFDITGRASLVVGALINSIKEYIFQS